MGAAAQRRLEPFYKNLALREYKFLMGNEAEMTLPQLRALLMDNEISDFDPVAEAFKVCCEYIVWASLLACDPPALRARAAVGCTPPPPTHIHTPSLRCTIRTIRVMRTWL